MAFELIITDAGKQALVNATQTGTRQLELSYIGVGTGQYTPSADQVALQNEVKRLAIIQASATDDHTIHVAYQDDSADSYNVYELGVYTASNVLFAVYSSSNLLISKAANSSCLLAVDVAIDDLNTANITFGDISFANGAATTENAGVVELATNAEAEAGTDEQRAVPPAGLAAFFGVQFDSAFSSEFSDAFNLAFQSYFPAAFDHSFEADFAPAFNSAFSPAFNSAFPSAFSSAFNSAFPGAFNGAFQNAFDAAFPNTFSTSFSSAFTGRLASSASTLTGTSSTYAVTPSGLKYAIQNMTWSVNKAQVTATGASAARGLADRFADRLTPMDFGAKGNGSTNDSAAFTALEAAFTGRAVDLCGKTFLVSSRPTGNDYFNGFFKVSGSIVSPSGVQIANGKIINAQGAANPDFFPSGVSRVYQATAGTNQVTLARFTDDDAGNSLIFWKSRASSVNTSKSAIAGDTIGWLNFMVDNGNINYSGSLQGAMACRIEGLVFESSSLTSSGTISNGVRGALRLTCNNDNSSREGSGIEVLSGALRPTTDDAIVLGTSGRRWKTIYATTGTISTSDEREKKNIQVIPEKILDAWERVNFKQFEFKDHAIDGVFFGVIAQDILAAFEAEGLNALDFGLIEKHEDIDGHYSVRYADCLILEAAVQRRKIERLEKMLKEAK